MKIYFSRFFCSGNARILSTQCLCSNSLISKMSFSKSSVSLIFELVAMLFAVLFSRVFAVNWHELQAQNEIQAEVLKQRLELQEGVIH